MSKYIFVTGGVLSGLGKGVAAASIGNLLKSRGYKIFVQKMDPYLNIDPGTMSPYEHGEVFVTEDGAETDLDLGHYERFIGEKFTKISNFTSGRIIGDVLKDERQGRYAGKTIQIVPHVTGQIVEIMERAAKESKADFIITEIGGTVGDIEMLPFIYATTQLYNKNPKDVFFIHTTYVPYLAASGEFKSKPTQHSIKELRQFGINPNLVLLRTNDPLPEKFVEKTARSLLMNNNSVVALHNLDNIYKVPLFLEEQKAADRILEFFNLKGKKANLTKWKAFVKKIDDKKKYNSKILMVGKYTEFLDAYMSIIEALKISSIYEQTNLKMEWLNSEKITAKNVKSKVDGYDGVVILPGFGERGFNGKVIVSQYLWEKGLPTLGICYGMQAMTIAQAKRRGIKDAISSEHSSKGTKIIDIIVKGKRDLGGTLRLGNYRTNIKDGSLAKDIYKKAQVTERHRHRFEVNPKYVKKVEDKTFEFSGFSEETKLVEICESKIHDFYIGVQYHPEFNANPLVPHPLFTRFLKAAKK